MVFFTAVRALPEVGLDPEGKQAPECLKTAVFSGTLRPSEGDCFRRKSQGQKSEKHRWKHRLEPFKLGARKKQ